MCLFISPESKDAGMSRNSWPIHLAEAEPELGPVLCPPQQRRTFLWSGRTVAYRGWLAGEVPFPHPFTSRVRVGLSRMTTLSTTTSASSKAWHTAVVRIMLSAFRYFSYCAYVIFMG